MRGGLDIFSPPLFLWRITLKHGVILWGSMYIVEKRELIFKVFLRGTFTFSPAPSHPYYAWN